MPIDKSQNAGGMRAQYDGRVTTIGCAWKISEVEDSLPCGDDALFERWLPPRGDGIWRNDYEVDGQGCLIRLGDQIEEELYPCEGLKMNWRDQQTGMLMVCTPYSDHFKTVKDVEQLGVGFISWADTPRNRELGLYKVPDYEVPSAVRSVMDVSAFAAKFDEEWTEDGTKELSVRAWEWSTEKGMWKLWGSFTVTDESDINPDNLKRGFYAGRWKFEWKGSVGNDRSRILELEGTPRSENEKKKEEVFMSDKEFKKGDKVIVNRAGSVCHGTVVAVGVKQLPHMTCDTPQLLIDRDDGVCGGGPNGEWVCEYHEAKLVEPSFKPFTKGEFEAAIKGHEGYDHILVSQEQFDALTAQVGRFEKAWHFWVKSGITGKPAVYDNDKMFVRGKDESEICTWTRAEGHSCVRKEIESDYAKSEKKTAVKLSSETFQNKKMISTQNKSLVFEETSWIKAKLPDGRIVESPMPSAKDGWKEYWSDRWQEGECSCVGFGDDYLIVIDKWHNENRLYESESSPFACWSDDMGHHLWEPVRRGLVERRTAILEAKKFKREKPVLVERGTWADTDDRKDSFFEHRAREFESKHCKIDWPDNAHVSGPLKWEK